ncbi:hypothetical protein [Laceyella sacchari]|uniref:Transposase n=1 Tax=Laceyella sacchari TaxID=37482 RepID=A0ABY5U5S0_LACSH|nr:hypothetical protein [Laceyella sacchari]UWE04987.1 hypothetical protein NYR52_07685 [Laceyella sacchari]
MGRSRKHPIRPDWEEVKEQVMRTAVYHKFKFMLIYEACCCPLVTN